MTHSLTTFLFASHAPSRGTPNNTPRLGSTSVGLVRKTAKPLSMELTAFLGHLSTLFGRIPPHKLDVHLCELREAVETLRSEMSPPALYARSPVQFNNLDLTHLRSMLAEVAAKTIKLPNALDREIKCDRLVSAYVRLTAAVDEEEGRIQASLRATRSNEMAALLSCEFESNSDKTEPPADPTMMLTKSRTHSRRGQNLIAARNSKLFLSGRNLDIALAHREACF